MKLKLLGPVMYDGKLLTEGSIVDVPKEHAEPLIAGKAAVDVAEFKRAEAERAAAEEAARKQMEADAAATAATANGTAGLNTDTSSDTTGS